MDSGNGKTDVRRLRKIPQVSSCVCFSVTARGLADNGISSKAPPSTQPLQVVEQGGGRSRQWFQEITEKITETKIQWRSLLEHRTQSMHLHTTHMRKSSLAAQQSSV